MLPRQGSACSAAACSAAACPTAAHSSGPLWDRPARLIRDDRGTVTAEFAVVVPAVLVVLGLVIGGIVISTNRLTLASAAADIARLEARGDTVLSAERIENAGPGVTVEREHRGSLLCITLRSGPPRGMLGALAVTGEACAAVTDHAAETQERSP